MYSDHVDDRFSGRQIFTLILISVGLMAWLLLPISSIDATPTLQGVLNSASGEMKAILFFPVICVLLLTGMWTRRWGFSALAIVAGLITMFGYVYIFLSLKPFDAPEVIRFLGLGFYIGTVVTFLLIIMSWAEMANAWEDL